MEANEVPLLELTTSAQFRWGTDQQLNEPCFLEIFAGEAGLTRAVADLSQPTALPIEIEVNPHVEFSTDILNDRVQHHILREVSSGRLWFVRFGTPCSSFSLARKDDGGPPPLRSKDKLWGLPGLAPHGRSKVEAGNMFMEISAKLIQACRAAHIGWSLENPAGSYLWLMPPIAALCEQAGVRRYELDVCQFGSPHMKPTAIVPNMDLQAIALRCDKAVRPHDHAPLVGKVKKNNKWIYRAKLAQVYPAQAVQLLGISDRGSETVQTSTSMRSRIHVQHGHQAL